MIRLVQTATAVAVSTPTPFGVIGGVPPYTFSVLPGGAGGSIASDGLYTAPSSLGQGVTEETDTVQVVDSNGLKAQQKILVGTPLALLCDVIKREMNLVRGQVYMWDQKIKIPEDSKLYVAVGIVSCKPFGNGNKQNTDGVTTTQSVNMQVLASLDILSRGPAARDRKEEVIMAIQSNYAQQQQALNSFYIAPISTGFVNLSEVDGAAIPYRFNISVAMQYFISKTRNIDYYDSFEQAHIVTNS